MYICIHFSIIITALAARVARALSLSVEGKVAELMHLLAEAAVDRLVALYRQRSLSAPLHPSPRAPLPETRATVTIARSFIRSTAAFSVNGEVEEVLSPSFATSPVLRAPLPHLRITAPRDGYEVGERERTRRRSGPGVSTQSTRHSSDCDKIDTHPIRTERLPGDAVERPQDSQALVEPYSCEDEAGYAITSKEVRGMIREAVLQYPPLLGCSVERMRRRLAEVEEVYAMWKWCHIVNLIRRTEDVHQRWLCRMKQLLQ